jgi:hypothetical protein
MSLAEIKLGWGGEQAFLPATELNSIDNWLTQIISYTISIIKLNFVENIRYLDVSVYIISMKYTMN